ncbi:hypothetical protein HHK36_028778 [Tetracentron sinense]|uniref:Uncharacterized protein n=1 Tax=Tetracentron sinense TaxID=13715 RepID=A0A834YGU3_TETSI|nr:hypothetical protein HHK36_028778 [Tetracentron sinense]
MVVNDKDGKVSKRKKKKVSYGDEVEGFAEDSGKKSGGDPKNQLFQRDVWSEDDEIVILKAKKDEDRTFTKPHEQKAFELSKKIWGGKDGDVEDDHIKANGKAEKKKKVSDEVVVPKPEVLAVSEV